jgi:thymidylate synthase
MTHFKKVPDSSDGWNYAKNYINLNGNNIITEDQKHTKEVQNLVMEIRNPLDGFPIKNSGWDINALNTYAEQLLDFSYDCKGFDYTYNERMSRQIYYITKILREHPTTRRATAYLWLPEKDLETNMHHPCQIVADYKLRLGKLYATHFFRSHDILQAWPTNVYGLAKLQEKITSDLNVLPGSLTTISASAHIYIE